jgi:flavin reductase (DIM6/NTAB) family NADH-FMN oxidoreductase RutF
MKDHLRTFIPESLSIKERHGLLLSAIGPRPIAWVSSIDSEGRPNLAPFSFFNIFSSNPPVLIFSPARSGRTNTTKHTLDNAIAHPEVVVNIVDHELLDQMVMTSLEYPQGISEFEKAGLSMIASERIAVPRVKEAPVQLECKVLEVRPLGSEGAAGNLVICEVVLIHVNKDILNAEGQIIQSKLHLLGRLGGAWYSKGYGESCFEVKSNPQETSVGYDAIPAFARDSEVLSAADLTLLAQAHQLPDETEVNDYKLGELSELFIHYDNDLSRLQSELIAHAKKELSHKNVEAAWQSLLAFNP